MFCACRKTATPYQLSLLGPPPRVPWMILHFLAWNPDRALMNALIQYSNRIYNREDEARMKPHLFMNIFKFLKTTDNLPTVNLVIILLGVVFLSYL